MRTSPALRTRSRSCSPWRRRQIARRRKERGRLIVRLIVAVLEHLYGEDQARLMWTDYLKSKMSSARREQVS